MLICYNQFGDIMFEREILLVGDKINLIKNKTVLVLGLGGVGGYVVESLIRAGIENIVIVDNDTIDLTNLNRQVISLHSNVGEYKVDAWEKRILDINPNVKVTKIKEFIDLNNIDLLFKINIDYVIDACDTITTKKELIRRCIKNNIKFISSMGTGNKFNPAKLEIIDVRKTSYDPIAKIIRKMIKDERIKEKVMVICSTEQPLKPKGKVGSISYVPSVAGLLCTSYVINDILGDKND